VTSARRGRPPKATADPLAVRDRILRAACDLFYREGVRAVGIDRVLEEADAAKASLYQHFGGKDELVAAYLEEMAARTREAVLARVDAPGDARARVMRLFDLLKEFSGERGFRGCAVLNATTEITDPRHPARAVTRKHRAWLHGLIHRLVTETGVRDADRVSAAIAVLYDGVVASARTGEATGAIDGARWAASRLLQ
jgi:AcrR family transcriptional regulator